MDKILIKQIAKKCTMFVDNVDTAGFDAFEAKCVAEHGPEAQDLITSFRALLEIEVLAKDANLSEEYRPLMWWMRGPHPGNFGDVLTPYVLWHAFGVAPRWTAGSRAEGIAIGSIAKIAGPGVKVWGAGMPRSSDPMEPKAVWAAVRGPMSRQVVLESGGSCPEVYGDPAVLLPELYDVEVEKTTDVGIIAHVLQEPGVRESLEGIEHNRSVKLISLLAGRFSEIEAVVREIKSCREIISTSLHGVIVAHAYGVPAQSARLVTSDEPAGDSFKMRDYKASVGLEDEPLSIPKGFKDLDWLDQRKCALPPSSIDTAALRAAFPFPVRLNG